MSYAWSKTLTTTTCTHVSVSKVTINNVEFAFNSAELSPAYRAELDSAFEFLKPHRSRLRQGLESLNVVGHTGSRGSEAYNRKLSQRRAQAVADYLLRQEPVRAAVRTGVSCSR